METLLEINIYPLQNAGSFESMIFRYFGWLDIINLSVSGFWWYTVPCAFGPPKPMEKCRFSAQIIWVITTKNQVPMGIPKMKSYVQAFIPLLRLVLECRAARCGYQKPPPNCCSFPERKAFALSKHESSESIQKGWKWLILRENEHIPHSHLLSYLLKGIC